MKKYTVTLPIEVGGKIYQSGSTVELDAETAALYSHALRAEPEAADGAPAGQIHAVETAGPQAVPRNAGEMINGRHS